MVYDGTLHPGPSEQTATNGAGRAGSDNQYFYLSYFTHLLFIKQDLHHLNGSLRYGSARTEDSSDASLVEEVLVLGRNYTTSNNHNILTSKLFQLFDQLRDEGLVTCSE